MGRQGRRVSGEEGLSCILVEEVKRDPVSESEVKRTEGDRGRAREVEGEEREEEEELVEGEERPD